jgi:uncharacterized membrane protein
MEEKTREQTLTTEAKEEKGTNPIAIFSYIGILFLIPLLVAKDDEFVKFHVKQGITLFLTWMIITFVWIIPIVGWLIGFVGTIFCIVATILGIVNVLRGKKNPLPLIGRFASFWKF